jgi:hypothetical protein
LRPVNTRRVPGIITQQGARGSRGFVVLRHGKLELNPQTVQLGQQFAEQNKNRLVVDAVPSLDVLEFGVT